VTRGKGRRDRGTRGEGETRGEGGSVARGRRGGGDVVRATRRRGDAWRWGGDGMKRGRRVAKATRDEGAADQSEKGTVST
jgi:hypothetical protein